MKDFWENRFLEENDIWGKNHSKTAELCLQYFSQFGVKEVLIPGVGYGRNANYFKKNGLKVEGIEISDQAIKIARDNGLVFPIFNGSVLEMPFSNKQYDGIYCFNVLHLFKQDDRKEFISKCYDQLANDGIVFFAVFSEIEPSYGKGKEIEENTFESKPGRPVHYFTDADLRKHFKEFVVLDSGLAEDPEEHGEEGAHTHIVRYIIAQKKNIMSLTEVNTDKHRNIKKSGELKLFPS